MLENIGNAITRLTVNRCGRNLGRQVMAFTIFSKWRPCAILNLKIQLQRNLCGEVAQHVYRKTVSLAVAIAC